MSQNIDRGPGVVNITHYRGDVFEFVCCLIERTIDGEEVTDTVIDTSVLDAKMMVRNTVAGRGNIYTTYCIADTSGGEKRGLITLGIVGSAPTGDDPDLRHNVSIYIPASVCESFPIAGNLWKWDIELWDPEDRDGTKRTWLAGSWNQINDVTYGGTT